MAINEPTKMELERIAVKDLIFDPANVRKHGEKNRRAIKGSLAKFSQQKPIVIDQNNVVLAGNGTLAEALALGWNFIYCVRSDLKGSDATGFSIADNRTAELAEWDLLKLADVCGSLKLDNFSLDDIGFDTKDLDKMFAKSEKTSEAAETGPDEWLLVVECRSETHQQELYERLAEEGEKCKIM